MENQRNLLTISLIAISILLYIKWIDFTKPEVTPTQVEQSISDGSLPNITQGSVPNAPSAGQGQVPGFNQVTPTNPAQLITVNTDLVVAVINTNGGVIESLELKEQPIEIDQPEKGFPLLKNTQEETFIVEDGLIIAGDVKAPNHQTALYQARQNNYDLGSSDQVVIPLTWTSEDGQK